MKNTEAIRKRIEKGMHARNIESAAELARRAGVDQTTIRRILKGEFKNISDNTTQAICKTLHIDERELLAIARGDQFNTVREQAVDYIADSPMIVDLNLSKDTIRDAMNASEAEGISLTEYFNRLITADRVRRGQS